MPQLTRAEALRVLGLDQAADADAVKRAYRRLARHLHPDVGGDPVEFHLLQRAYERLADPDARPPATQWTRASRPPGADWAEAPTRPYSDAAVDLDPIDWEQEVPESRHVRAELGLVAVLLARPADGPVHPLTGRSRGPHSPLNRLIPILDPDLTATWTIAPARERPHHDVDLRLRVWSRAGRRRVDGARLPAGWTAERGSSSTTAVRRLHPSRNRRATATRAAGTLQEGLEMVGWPLTSWFLDLTEG